MPLARTTSGGTGVEDSQGTIFVLGTKKYKATKISVKFGGGSSSSKDDQIEVSHLELATGATREYQAPPLADVSSSGGSGVLATVTCDLLGCEKPAYGVSIAFDLGAKLAYSGTCKITELENTAQVNDILRTSIQMDILSMDNPYKAITPAP